MWILLISHDYLSFIRVLMNLTVLDDYSCLYVSCTCILLRN